LKIARQYATAPINKQTGAKNITGSIWGISKLQTCRRGCRYR